MKTTTCILVISSVLILNCEAVAQGIVNASQSSAQIRSMQVDPSSVLHLLSEGSLVQHERLRAVLAELSYPTAPAPDPMRAGEIAHSARLRPIEGSPRRLSEEAVFPTLDIRTVGGYMDACVQGAFANNLSGSVAGITLGSSEGFWPAVYKPVVELPGNEIRRMPVDVYGQPGVSYPFLSVVPEPSTAVLSIVGIGVLIMGYYGRHKARD